MPVSETTSFPHPQPSTFVFPLDDCNVQPNYLQPNCFGIFQRFECVYLETNCVVDGVISYHLTNFTCEINSDLSHFLGRHRMLISKFSVV
jgi:hypothetical protein